MVEIGRTRPHGARDFLLARARRLTVEGRVLSVSLDEVRRSWVWGSMEHYAELRIVPNSTLGRRQSETGQYARFLKTGGESLARLAAIDRPATIGVQPSFVIVDRYRHPAAH